MLRMARLQEFLKEHGIDPEWFLEQAGSDGAFRHRWRLKGVKSPRDYIDSAFYWTLVRCPGYGSWADLEEEWHRSEPLERWLELEKVFGWLDPLEYELMEVKDGIT